MGRDKFTYRHPNGQTEQLPTQPSYLQRVVENVTYPEDVDKQRDAYNRANAQIHSPDKSSAIQTEE